MLQQRSELREAPHLFWGVEWGSERESFWRIYGSTRAGYSVYVKGRWAVGWKGRQYVDVFISFCCYNKLSQMLEV